jgi:hemerythrin superfamily protein
MDAIELLTADHDEVRALFERFRTAHEQDDTAAMAEVAEQVMAELDVHTTIEEEIFYPAVRDADGEDLDEEVAEAIQEHHVVEVLMNEMADLDPADEEWVAKMQVLMENVEHHASEEEDDMFPDVREAMDPERLQDLGRQMQARKESARSAPLSRDELYAKAKQLDIEGRSKMTKKELEQAVSAASG